MDETYKKYLIENWKDAEEVAKEVGCTDNKAVIVFFRMISQPYFFWVKENKK